MKRVGLDPETFQCDMCGKVFAPDESWKSAKLETAYAHAGHPYRWHTQMLCTGCAEKVESFIRKGGNA